MISSSFEKSHITSKLMITMLCEICFKTWLTFCDDMKTKEMTVSVETVISFTSHLKAICEVSDGYILRNCLCVKCIPIMKCRRDGQQARDEIIGSE